MLRTRGTILLLLTAFVWSAGPARAAAFTLCEGQYPNAPRNRCGEHDAYTPCFTADARARAKCGTQTFRKTKLFNAHGDLCGYHTWRIDCEK
jgi:hypothetical protein